MIYNAAKITLSDKERELVCNTEWIFTKHMIIQKVYQLYGNLLPDLKIRLDSYENRLPGELFSCQAKISKGENYQQLPWVMMDYPRIFNKTDVFAIRTFFWWGKVFSISLQASGKYRPLLAECLPQSFNYLQEKEYWICVHHSAWEHHFEKENYLPIASLSFADFSRALNTATFIKLAKKIPVDLFDNASEFISGSFDELLQLAAASYAPSR